MSRQSRERTSLNKIVGDIKRARGNAAEVRFFDAMERYRAFWPEWLRAVFRGNSEDDRAGVDGFADVDIGRIKIQVKSSRFGVAKASMPATIATPIVRLGFADEAIYRVGMLVIFRAREAVIAAREAGMQRAIARQKASA